MTAAGHKVYPMTREQEAMWIDDHLDDGPSSYLESWALTLTGPADLAAVEWALARLVDRHEALRTTLRADGDDLVQVVRPARQGIRLIRRTCPAADLGRELREAVRQPLHGEPQRAMIWTTGPDKHVLLVQLHHAVVDDWALSVLDREFADLYAARTQGRPAGLATPPQLGEYALAQRAAGTDAAALGYWRDRLRQLPPLGAVPPDRPRPRRASHRGGQVGVEVGVETAALVRKLCRARRVTAFAVFAAALAVLLCRRGEAGEAIIGTPVSRRGPASMDGLVGCLTGLLPLRLPVGPGETFASLVAAARQEVWAAVAHQNLPYPDLVAKAVSRRDLGRQPLCQAVLVLDDVRQAPLPLPGLTAERLYLPSGTAKFDLCLTLMPAGSGYRGFLDYASDLYDPGTAEGAVREWTAVLRAGVGDPDAPLGGRLTAGQPAVGQPAAGQSGAGQRGDGA